ncbi:FMN-binding negative transcriptional regulator [Pseudomonas aestusnigri]|jgi:transcriptional regulator|uniref:FMN-binding negative transcriptional regulator n=1 Tax=Halopseudomonas aestusnigri TaxID=857252 RepID=UPI001D1902A7|nr:FMN-binding negative transcriptional regulator [Halopseudomonas aestusnigri]MCC4262243.1 FMN-binding negative transcriptional regulator [Halopseudomonas aestusnigri]
MYLPAHFAETRTTELHALIGENPLGTLVTVGPDGLDANHIPFELLTGQGEQGVLQAHLARANPLVEQIVDGMSVMVVFQGPQAYISPNWYPSKHETHQQVPTWNYQVVHAHGRIHLRDDERFVRGIVARLTREHETRAQELPPWRMTDSSPDYIARMLAAIVGIEIEIERLVGKFKLSQNKTPQDVAGAVDALAHSGHAELAAAMNKPLV